MGRWQRLGHGFAALAEAGLPYACMSRRIDIELTSKRADGSFTWRAAGAKQPKGEIDSTMAPAGANVGDVLKVDIEKHLDGISVVAVVQSKDNRVAPERLEILGSKKSDDLVTVSLAEKGKGRPRSDRGDRPRDGAPGRDRDHGPRRRNEGGDRAPRRPGTGDKPDRPSRDRRPGASESRARPEGRSPRPARERPAAPPMPRAKRLRPSRAHRQAALSELPEEARPLGEIILRGGIQAVRQAIDKQNAQARAEGTPEVKGVPLMSLAEQLLPRLRAAEWRDRAEAALAGVADVDLRDLRQVVVAADTAGRDDATRELAERLRGALSARVDSEHGKWLEELTELVNDGRTVRALRLSSRPPKAGAPLPPDLAERLALSTSSSLTAEISQDRWATLVDAVALSPVRTHVLPLGVPAKPNDELLTAIKRLAPRVPQIAAMFGVSAEAPPRPPRPPRPPKPATAEAVPSGDVVPSADVAPSATEEVVPSGDVAPSVVEEAVPSAEAVPSVVEEAVPADVAADETTASADGGDDPVVVEELGETVDEG